MQEQYLIRRLRSLLRRIEACESRFVEPIYASELKQIYARMNTDLRYISEMCLVINNDAYQITTDAGIHLCESLIDVISSNSSTPQDDSQDSNRGYHSDIALDSQDTDSCVFIVHGHDHANLFRLQNMLKDRFNLTPIILSEQPSRSLTIIEKFEKAAASVRFCIALFTPDDEIAGASGVYQPRPNAIFELGWFCGQLGRSRVRILCRKGTNIHSDLAGIARIEFADSINECLLELERELKASNVC